MSAPLKLVPSWATDDYSLDLLEKFSSLRYSFGSRRTSYDGPYSKTLCVTFKMDAKLWTKYRNSGWLGSLYGIDLVNYLSRSGIINEYAVPTVSDRDRASKGIKTIHVEYVLRGAK